jgi:hypothetical protein
LPVSCHHTKANGHSQQFVSLITFYDGIGGYNLPITLFGIVAHQQTSSAESWKQFLIILCSSFFLDLFGLFGRASGLGFLLGVVLVGLKAAVYFSGMRTLRERGDDLRWGSLGDMVRNPRGAFQGGQTTGPAADNGNNSQTSKLPSFVCSESLSDEPLVWQMPGSFGGGAPPAGTPPTFPSGGGFRLGTSDEDPERDAGVGHQAPSGVPGRGGYQALP